ncbi:hypothetical protein C7B61_12715 [filamentous cyanobacterium CCP1]|nr:hypothetical protein C7B76_08665 [filamentous cyanobacterium CCP2]PSB64003.1 hypothetical protein C7B61_12715 [filamentous cyanobacterium CCP1]
MSLTTTVPKLDIGSVDLTPMEIDFFKAICNNAGYSRRVMAGMMIKEFFKRSGKEQLKEIAYTAFREGLTVEQTYTLLAIGEKSPPFSDADKEWVRSQSVPPLNFDEVLRLIEEERRNSSS